SVRFNQTETSILASCGSDSTVTLYDLRTSKPLFKVVLAALAYAVTTAPDPHSGLESHGGLSFTLANEDHNLYTFDMRKLSSAAAVYTDHVAPVMDVDYWPTGQEFVTGGYDCTMRIFRAGAGLSESGTGVSHSREIYHTGLSSAPATPWTPALYCRLRTTATSAVEGRRMAPHERVAADYCKAVKERFKHMPEVRRIDKRTAPSTLPLGSRPSSERAAERRREENAAKNSGRKPAGRSLYSIPSGGNFVPDAHVKQS
ncbi:rRNA-processing protein sof1, partial [Cladochytrium tenue]